MYEIFSQLLQSRGKKTADVSRATGINQTVFSEWKKGKSTPKADKLQKIAEYFGVSLAYLMGWEEWDKEAQRFEDDFNDRENKMISLLSTYLTDPKEIDTAVEIIRQFPRLNSEGLKKLLDRVDELVKLGYTSDIEKELMNM